MLNYDKIFEKLGPNEKPEKAPFGALIFNPPHTGGVVFTDRESQTEFVNTYYTDWKKYTWARKGTEAGAEVPIKAIAELKKVAQKAKKSGTHEHIDIMIAPGKLRAYADDTLTEWDMAAYSPEVVASSAFSVGYLSAFLSPIKRGVAPVEIYVEDKGRLTIRAPESALFLAPVIYNGRMRVFDRQEPYVEDGKIFLVCDICKEMFWSATERCPRCDMDIGLRWGDRQEYNQLKYGEKQ